MPLTPNGQGLQLDDFMTIRVKAQKYLKINLKINARI